MITPQRNGHRAHSPGRRPRPLEITLNASNGGREFGFFLTSQPASDADSRLTTDRTGFHLSVTHSAVRSTRYVSLGTLVSSSLTPPVRPTFPCPCPQTINRSALFVLVRNRSATPTVDQLCSSFLKNSYLCFPPAPLDRRRYLDIPLLPP